MAEGKILLILVIALVVLGPEKLPKLAADIGRWIGRARAMARQLQSQLDQEVHVNNLLREQQSRPAPPADPTYSHAHAPGEEHPDYAAGRAAAAAAMAQMSGSPPPPPSAATEPAPPTSAPVPVPAASDGHGQSHG